MGPWLLAVVALGAATADGGKTVFLFRHCVRSINESALTQYAADPFPAYGVPADYCLPRGLSIFQGIGAQLRSSVGPSPSIIADAVARNIDSAHALAAGLGLPASAVQVDSAPFAHCDAPSKDEKNKLILERFRTVPRPANWSGMIAAIDTVLGGATKIASQPDKVEDGSFKGESALAADAAESFMMQLGGGLDVGWGQVSDAEAYRLLAMQVYNWAVTRRISKLERAKSSRMLAAILTALAPDTVSGYNNNNNKDPDMATPAGSDTTVFLGHDTDVNGVGTILDIGWSAPPFPDNTTAPSVALRFATDGGTIAIDFVYTRLELGTGALQSTPIANLTVANFCETVAGAVDWSCAIKPKTSVCSGYD